MFMTIMTMITIATNRINRFINKNVLIAYSSLLLDQSNYACVVTVYISTKKWFTSKAICFYRKNIVEHFSCCCLYQKMLHKNFCSLALF